MNRDLPRLLAARLRAPLPGPMIRARFEPQPGVDWCYDTDPPGARRAAVLVLLYPHLDSWHVLLTERPAGLSVHPGQISLPGGAVEPGETGRLAALRELHEELGAMDQPIELLGRLSAVYTGSSNFRVEPWVGAAPRRPELVPNTTEVAAVLEIPLAYLLDPASFGSHPRQYQGELYFAPQFSWGRYSIWGVTCMILSELVALLRELRIEG